MDISNNNLTTDKTDETNVIMTKKEYIKNQEDLIKERVEKKYYKRLFDEIRKITLDGGAKAMVLQLTSASTLCMASCVVTHKDSLHWYRTMVS